MIVEMSRVPVLGPKRLLGQVMDEVQRLGTLHVDRVESEEAPEVTALQLGEEDAKTLQALERALARVDGLLALLPPGSAEPGDAPGDAAVDALDAEVAEIERKVRDLTRKRLELDEERQLIASYEGAVRVLSPLLSALSNSKAFESIGFLLNTKDLTVVAALRNELVKAMEGRVEVISRIVDDKRIGVVVAFLRRDGERGRAILSRAGATELRLPAPVARGDATETIAIMERRKGEVPAEIGGLDRGVGAHAAAARPRVLPLHPPRPLLLRPPVPFFTPPRWGGGDPGRVMAIPFPIFGGLVMGDMGWGLLLLLGGWWLGGGAGGGRALNIIFLSMRSPPL